MNSWGRITVEVETNLNNRGEFKAVFLYLCQRHVNCIVSIAPASIQNDIAALVEPLLTKAVEVAIADIALEVRRRVELDRRWKAVTRVGVFRASNLFVLNLTGCGSLK